MCTYNKSTYWLQTLLLVAAILAMGCKKFIDIDPPTNQVASDNVFKENATATAVLTGLYAQMSNDGIFTGRGSISLKAGLSADELVLYGNNSNEVFKQLYLNALDPRNAGQIWLEAYQYINVANTAIEGLNQSQTLTEAVKQQLIGEALFIRAFLHFYLVNLYDSIPLVTTSDYRINNTLSRSAPAQVYNQIVEDLAAAIPKLSENYLAANVQDPTGDRVRPTKWAAEALLARASLFKKDDANAIVHATNVINQTALFDTTQLNDVFLATSREAIWQLAPIDQNFNTRDGNLFIIETKPNFTHPAFCSPSLLAAFEPGDARRSNWIDSVINTGTTYFFPFKYKILSGGPPVEYTTVLRLAELYLVRAEANANQGNLDAANADLNLIRKRARLPQVNYSNKEDLLTAILHERQVEFFTEWGHRWFDLKRSNKLDAVMSVVTPLKGGTWKPTAKLFPIPLQDLLRNSNLTQNSGY